jgi:hypothetical protein
VIAERAVDDDDVARLRVHGTKIDTGGDEPDTCGVDEHLVRRAARHDLGVAGDDRDAGRCRRLGHRANDAAKERDVESLLQDHRAAQIQRLRAADRKVVHGPVDGQRPDVTAGEEQRIHDI